MLGDIKVAFSCEPIKQSSLKLEYSMEFRSQYFLNAKIMCLKTKLYN